MSKPVQESSNRNIWRIVLLIFAALGFFVSGTILLVMLVYSALLVPLSENGPSSANGPSGTSGTSNTANYSNTISDAYQGETSQNESQQKAEYTVMFYVIGSNLETESGFATDNLSLLTEVTFGSDTNVLIQTGGALDWRNNLMIDGQVQRFSVKERLLYEEKRLGVTSMVESNTL